LDRARQVPLVDFAQGHHLGIRLPQKRLQIGDPLAAQSDASDRDAFGGGNRPLAADRAGRDDRRRRDGRGRGS
jgi:hypothetical protein